MTSRFAQLKPAQKTAIIITVVLLAYLLVANLFSSDEQQTEERVAETSTKDVSSLVKVEALDAQLHPLHIVLNGVTEANRLVRLKAQVEGAVKSIEAQEGDTLKKGDVIMRIDVRDRQARLAQAKALLEQRRVEYQAAKKLNKKGVYSDVRFAQSHAEYEAAKAMVSSAQDDFNNTTIRAPFAGVLEELSVEVGDLVGRGFVVQGDDSVATVVDFDPLIAVGQIPQQRRADLQTDQPATIRLFGDDRHQGTIRYIGSVTNSDTRTFRVEVEIPNPDGKLPIGISAEMRLPAGRALAYNVAPSVLSQDDGGNVGVKTVDEHGIVQFSPVTLLEDSGEGFWIGGLPDSVRLITTGQNFVSAGQSLNTSGATKSEPAND